MKKTAKQTSFVMLY